MTTKTVKVGKVTMAGGGGSAGFEQEKGRSACVFIRLRSVLKLEDGICTCYRLGWYFIAQSSEILDGSTFCYRKKAHNSAVSSLKVSFFAYSGSRRPISPHVYMTKSFSF